MFQNILTVCTGNICRSPLAEALLGAQRHSGSASGPRVSSAGIAALVGEPAEVNVQRLAVAEGLDLSAHRARQLTASMTREADLILAMEPHHLRYIVRLDPTARGKTYLLGHWLGIHIPDPYRRSEENYVFTQACIAKAVQSWQQKIV